MENQTNEDNARHFSSLLSGNATVREDMPLVVGIVRSHTAGAKPENSIESQMDRIGSACARHFHGGYSLVFSVDDNGKPDRSDRGLMREQLRQILELAERGCVQYVCAVYPDRVSRRVREYLEFLEGLERHGVELLIVNEEGTLAPANDQAARSLHIGMLRYLCDVDRGLFDTDSAAAANQQDAA